MAYKYNVELPGVSGRDYERLSRIATHPSLTVVQRENGGYGLCSEDLDALDDFEEIVALAERKVAMLNGLLEIQDAQSRSITVGAVHSKDEIRVLVGAAEVPSAVVCQMPTRKPRHGLRWVKTPAVRLREYSDYSIGRQGRTSTRSWRSSVMTLAGRRP